MPDVKSTKTELTCQCCGNPFLVWTYRHVKENRRFCSWKCRYSLTVNDRFWARVIKGDGCWGWAGHINTSGYGSFSVNKKTAVASRVSWQIHFGGIPDGMVVCHRCDNRPCTNPDHLFLGTVQDNNDDCTAKGRRAMGANHGMSKLTPEIVVSLRLERARGVMLKDLSAKYGFSMAAISSAVTGRTWSHVSS